jgi:hypothetical protein
MVAQMSEVMEPALGVFAIWVVWQIADVFLTADRWIWWSLCLIAGVAWMCAFVNPSWWWQGLGVGGAAVFLGVVADCLLLLGDFCRVSVLRNSRST